MSFKKTLVTGVLALSVMAGAGSAYAAPAGGTNLNDIVLKNGSNVSDLINNLQNKGWDLNVAYPDLFKNIQFGNDLNCGWNPDWNNGAGTGTGGSDDGSNAGTGSNSGGNTGTDVGTTPGGNTGTTPGTNNGTGGNGQSTGNSSTASTYANQVVDLVNQERAKAGLAPLTSDPALTNMALDKAKDMYNNNYFDHTSPTYGSPFDMMNQYGIRYSYAGENIAKGQRNPQEVMNAWMNSDGHRKNILSANFAKIGVAYYNGVWVQEFIK